MLSKISIYAHVSVGSANGNGKWGLSGGLLLRFQLGWALQPDSWGELCPPWVTWENYEQTF